MIRIATMAFAAAGPADPLTNVIERCRVMVSTDAPRGVALLTPAGPIGPNDLPLDPFDSRVRVRSIVDRITNHAGPFDLPALHQLLQQRRYDELPDILKPRHMPENGSGTKMTLCVRPNQGTPDYTIIKKYDFEYPWSVAHAEMLIHGEAMQVRYIAPQVQLSKRVFQYIFEVMGGLLLLWQRIGNAEDDAEDKRIDDGYDYIEKTAPRSTSGTLIARWMDKSLLKANCPIFGWSAQKVEKAVKNLQSGGNLSKCRLRYPLTLRDLSPVLMRYIIGPHLASLRRKSMVMVGENNIGKTPCMETLCFAFAFYWVEKDGVNGVPQVRTAPDMDFFRGDPGTKYTPFIYDDGDASELETRKLKARSRKGSCSFVIKSIININNNDII